ncbi:MAG TPA: DUF3857 domain-containing protein [Candidatus Kryptonia bacterium]
MKTILLLAAAILMPVISISCSSSSFVDLESLKTELGVKDFPEQKDYPDADALVLSEVHNVLVYIDNDYKVRTVESVTRVVKLFRNIEDNASVEIWSGPNDKLTNLSARTIKPDGSIIEVKDEDFHTITGNGSDYVFYSDRKKTRFTFPGIEKNCIVEYHYDMREAYPFIQDQWDIQEEDLPKLRADYTLTVPVLLMAPESQGGAGWSWRYMVYNCDLGKPVVKQQQFASESASIDRNVTFDWVQTNIPAFKPDPRMPSYDKYVRYVRFAPSDWKTWNDISDWYYKQFFQPHLIMTDEISAKAKEITSGSTDELDKIEKTYEFVQKLTYIAIEIGKGGYAPSEPQKVLERKYGDCKDKSILLLSLLKSLGIKAKPVLVLTSDEGVVHADFPSWEFNHMIVKVFTQSGKSYWLDPTVDHCPVGEIPSGDEGVNALVMNDDATSTIETIPSSRYTDNVENIDLKVKIAGTNETDFDITMTFKGQSNFETRSFFYEKTHDEMIKFCKSLVANEYLNASVEDYSFSDLDSLNNDLVFNFKLKVPNALEKQGDMIFLNTDPFTLRGDWSWLSRDKRTYDIEFNYPYTINKTIEIDIPRNQYKIMNMPKYAYLTSDGLYYMKNYEDAGDGHIKILETFSVKSRDIPAGSYTKMKSLIETMRTKASEKIVLTANQ